MPRSQLRAYKQLGLPQLRSFCEVCRTGGYAAAARSLLLTSPAVWEQVKALERHYGFPLLERLGNGVRPTNKGRQLLEMILPLLAGLDSTREVLQQQDGAPAQLTFVTNLRVLVDEISRALRRFQALYPKVRLKVLYTGIDEVEPLVLEGAADVTLTLEPGPDRKQHASLVYEPAGEVDYLLVTPPRHPLMRQRVLHLEQIARYPLVLGEPAAYSRHRVQEVMHRYNLADRLHIGVETSSDEYTLNCVRERMGIGITVGTGQGHLYYQLAVRSLRRWFGTARVGFLRLRGAHIPAVERALMEHIRNELPKARQSAPRTKRPR